MKKVKLTIITLLIAVLSVHQLSAQCPIPSGLAASTMGANSSSLTWQPVSGVTSYLVNVENGRNNPTAFLVTGTTVTPSFTVNGMIGGYVYKFKVRSNCGGNHSSLQILCARFHLNSRNSYRLINYFYRSEVRYITHHADFEIISS